MPHGPAQFRSTVVKPYYKDNGSDPLQDTMEDVPENAPEDATEGVPDNVPENHNQRVPEGDYDSDTIVVDVPQPQTGIGRPKGSHLVDFEEPASRS